MALTVSAVGAELLDDPRADENEVRESLTHIARSNRLFGGASAVRWGLRTMLADAGALRVSVLDIGAGAGDIAASISTMAIAGGATVQVTTLERHPAAAAMLREGRWPVVLADAAALPFAAGAFDIVIMSQFLHHFARPSAVALLASAAHLARRGVIVADLERSAVARAAFAVGARALRFDQATRVDGLTSIRRGYRRHDLQSLIAEAGLSGRVVRRPGWRVVGLIDTA